MVRSFVSGVVFALLPAIGVAGNCTTGIPGNWNQGSGLSGLLICASATSGDSWQEYHDPSGTLVEYAKGPTDPVDPTHNVGTWSTVVPGGSGGVRTVGYDYGGSSNYTFDVYINWDDPSNGRGIIFCQSGSGTQLIAQGRRYLSGLGPCP